ncbi:hypothetical protein FW778_03310 [Ginsengibacter hankyongi]|uniref:Uncharacterized protein n=1 Tax=Ginsengibacter hankyongi TaxID=2607284 RepID=A0A5J5INI6_9BACT|nr:hypothetical protein [Ginsengibacter hankyongi]KAA9041082.1 hypothetical protein FW778_03310 [Ginsengibacter hankyongi]
MSKPKYNEFQIFDKVDDSVTFKIETKMANSFFVYLQQLELMAFFSGYPLIYAVIIYFAGNKRAENNFKTRILAVLPFAYAFTGTLYLGLQLKKLYFNYSSENVKLLMHSPYLMIWALISILFWIPAVGRKRALSLLHSLVFFFFLVKDIILQFASSADENILKNDMRIYTVSLLLNIGSLVLMLLLSFLFLPKKKQELK